MSDLSEQFKDEGLVVLAVSVWDEDKTDLVRSFVDEKRLKHRILLDGTKVHRQCGLRGTPAVLWIDRHGVVTNAELTFHGPASLEAKTRELLADEG